MIYPDWLKKDDLIGFTALSSGSNHKYDSLKQSLTHYKDYKYVLTDDCYGDNFVSNTKEVRSNEFNNLVKLKPKMISILAGGDLLLETIPLIDYKQVVKNKIWVSGMSDPTSILYILTTKYDLATIYGFNGKQFNDFILPDYKKNYFDTLKGYLKEQKSYDKDSVSINGNFKDSGLLIGGCLDVIRNLIGTNYDNTRNFIEKYKDKKIIWYFDIYSMNSIDTYLTLLQMEMNGFFKYTDTILIGKVMFPSENGISYEEGYKRVFKNKNIVYDLNIGHTEPRFTLINGCLGNIRYNNKMIHIDMDSVN